jgi:hypothetical protein
VAQASPAHAQAIITGARTAFLSGAHWAYAAGCIAIAVGALIVGVAFPNHAGEVELLATYAATDAADAPDVER